MGWRRWIAVGVAVTPLFGCGALGLGTLATLSAGTTSVATATQRIARVSGTIRLPDSLMAGRSLADLPPLTPGTPLQRVAAIAGVSEYAAQSLAGPRIQAIASPVTGGAVEFVDLETGQVASSTEVDSAGRFTATLTISGHRHPFMAQIRIRNASNQVAGFLAAPLGLDLSQPAGKRAAIEVSPATTVLAAAATLLSESYPTFDPTRGFEGVVSTRLALMVGELAPSQVQAASGLMDASQTLSQARTFDGLWSDLATASAVMTYDVRQLARTALATDSLALENPGVNAAILSQFVERLPSVQPGTGQSGFFSAVMPQVNLDVARQRGSELAKALPDLPPLPSPTPPQGLDVSFQ